MLLSYNKLLDLQRTGVIQNSTPDLVNAASIDIRLGNIIKFQPVYAKLMNKSETMHVTLADRDPLPMMDWDLSKEEGYLLAPGEFILAHTIEVFNLPNDISAEYKCKSSMARVGLNHLNAGWCDAGWHGSVLTLELKNENQTHAIRLQAGDKIGQMIFHKHEEVPTQGSYATKGHYNNHGTVMGAVADDNYCLH